MAVPPLPGVAHCSSAGWRIFRSDLRARPLRLASELLRRPVMRLRLASLVLGAVLTVPAFAQTPVLSDAEILEILERRVEDEQQGVGLVVAVVEPEGTRVVSYGTLSLDDPTPVDGDTLFEIGSVTKVFTTLLLADAVVRGEVSLDQPVVELLPEGVTVPERDGIEITLRHLATQHSGLPRLPDNFDPADPADPYADYTEEDLYAFLADYALPREIDADYEYSNLGMGLLGHALALRAGTDYRTLLRERILDPLGMDDTELFAADPEQADRSAVGHDASLDPVSDWNWDVLAGAGVMRSTGNDMAKFVAALVGQTETELDEAIALATEQHAGVDDGTGIALGWYISPTGDDAMIWHNGATFGSSAMVAFLRDSGVGVAALSNVQTIHGVTDLVSHLLVPEVPLVVPPQPVAVDPAVFEGLVGEYALAPEVSITVFTEDERLFAQLTGQEPAEIFPLSETEYFYRIVDAQIVFETDAEGRATGLTLHQFGEEMPAERVE
jgi:D-alanyl-D-alanine-carboxypeptidase/D-alanyl-D-alanine-endopeptidase